MLQRLSLSLAVLLCSPCAFAQTRYVDAVNGLDTNDGRTPATAWRTLTRATAQPPVARSLSVAAGTHDAALGEVFPIVIPSGVVVRGSQIEADRAVIDAGGAPVAVEVTGPLLGRVNSLVVQNASIGVRCRDADLDLSRLLVRDCRRGIDIASPAQDVEARLRDLVVRACGDGVVVDGRVVVDGDECLVEEIERAGILCTLDPAGAPQGTGSRQLRFSDSRIDRCGGTGFTVTSTGAETSGVWLSRLQVLRCGTGVDVDLPVPLRPLTFLWVREMSVVGNGVGLRVDSIDTVQLLSSVVDGNGVDVVDLAGTAVAADSHVGDGSIPAASTGDALLVDPANGDLRPSFSSPLVDRGSLAGAIKRDGDLDAERRQDWGAVELLTLSPSQVVPLGGTATFEVFGPAGAMAVGLIGDWGASTETAFGRLELVASSVRRQSVFPIQPGLAPTVWEIPIPNDPALVGSYGVQAWIPSPDAPAGAALTTSPRFLVVP